jgi:hypothetical protein
LFERRVTPRFDAIAKRFDAIDKKFGLRNKGLDSSTETRPEQCTAEGLGVRSLLTEFDWRRSPLNKPAPTTPSSPSSSPDSSPTSTKSTKASASLNVGETASARRPSDSCCFSCPKNALWWYAFRLFPERRVVDRINPLGAELDAGAEQFQTVAADAGSFLSAPLLPRHVSHIARAVSFRSFGLVFFVPAMAAQHWLIPFCATNLTSGFRCLSRQRWITFFVPEGQGIVTL